MGKYLDRYNLELIELEEKLTSAKSVMSSAIPGLEQQIQFVKDQIQTHYELEQKRIEKKNKEKLEKEELKIARVLNQQQLSVY